MDVLWSPWRYQYVTAKPSGEACVFCQIAEDRAADAQNLVLGRAGHSYLVLNRFPYSTAHLMVVPYAHISSLASLDDAALFETVLLAKQVESVLAQVYRPGGLNVGWNLGQCAGAGIAQHLHLHIVPRWPGDSNFMTTIGETRVIPESLQDTHRRLAPHFASLSDRG